MQGGKSLFELYFTNGAELYIRFNTKNKFLDRKDLNFQENLTKFSPLKFPPHYLK